MAPTEPNPADASHTGGGDDSVGEELVRLIRGFFATPIMSAFARLGVLQTMQTAPTFSVDDFPQIPNKTLLGHGLRYFHRIGLLEATEPSGPSGPPPGQPAYRPTELGQQVFKRWSSFLAPHSYREYLYHFGDELQNTGAYRTYEVDRLENIIGSGRTHERYFPAAVTYLRRRAQFDVMLDVGCGDGQFLDLVLKNVPRAHAFGIDLSPVSVNTTREKLRAKYPEREIDTFCADAMDLAAWAPAVTRFAHGRPLAISLWFLLHEISHRRTAPVVELLSRVHDTFPDATLVICELVQQSADLLVDYRRESIMPEYMWFHDASNQGPLTWDQYHEVLDQIPYELATERTFDDMRGADGRSEPATFVWCLTPTER
jgi:SAM-dependent methyltransferase